MNIKLKQEIFPPLHSQDGNSRKSKEAVQEKRKYVLYIVLIKLQV